jgi:hypothetical protein
MIDWTRLEIRARLAQPTRPQWILPIFMSLPVCLPQQSVCLPKAGRCELIHVSCASTVLPAVCPSGCWHRASRSCGRPGHAHPGGQRMPHCPGSVRLPYHRHPHRAGEAHARGGCEPWHSCYSAQAVAADPVTAANPSQLAFVQVRG